MPGIGAAGGPAGTPRGGTGGFAARPIPNSSSKKFWAEASPGIRAASAKQGTARNGMTGLRVGRIGSFGTAAGGPREPASHHAGRSSRSVNTASVAEAWPRRNKMQAGGRATKQGMEASRHHSDAMHGRNSSKSNGRPRSRDGAGLGATRISRRLRLAAPHPPSYIRRDAGLRRGIGAVRGPVPAPVPSRQSSSTAPPWAELLRGSAVCLTERHRGIPPWVKSSASTSAPPIPASP